MTIATGQPATGPASGAAPGDYGMEVRFTSGGAPQTVTCTIDIAAGAETDLPARNSDSTVVNLELVTE